jgi:guanylate kinase
VFVVSGPSGAGKGTLISRVLPRFPRLVAAVSATTRRPRPGEVAGVDYHFLTEDEFAARVRAGDFLEHVRYAGNRYGTLRAEVERPVAAGESVVLELELRGARAVRRELPEAVAIFIAPPSIEELGRRLERRAANTEAEIAERLRVGAGELEGSAEFDHVIVNSDAASAAEELAAVIGARVPRG